MEVYGVYKKQFTTASANKETAHVYFPPDVGSMYYGYRLKRIFVSTKSTNPSHVHSFSFGYSSSSQPYTAIGTLENTAPFDTRRPGLQTMYVEGKACNSSSNLSTTQVGTFDVTGTSVYDMPQSMLNSIPGQSTGANMPATLPKSIVIRKESGADSATLFITVVFEQIES